MKDCVVVHDALKGCWLHFQDPRHIITTTKTEDVMPSLELMEGMVRDKHLYAAGFISYDASKAFDPAFEIRGPDSTLPLVWFGLYEKADPIEPEAKAYAQQPPIEWKDTLSGDEYNEAIRRIKEYLRNGETYQVNYTYRMRAYFNGDPWPLFVELVEAQDAKYACYIDTQEFSVCSASPELFFSLDGESLTSLPMKGTAPRGMLLREDVCQGEHLQASEKNRAENLMIVDMVRNDMGRVAHSGTVEVPRLFSLERYPTLWQMTSEVKARTDAGLTQIFGALFPPASITGAPKQRTMQIIAELESTPRGLYSGCTGFVRPDGRAQFNVAIRTVVVDKQKNHAQYGVGGGIVWDSEDSEESEECRTKTMILSRKYPEFSLLESILWNEDDGFFLLDEHLERLRSSAEYFDFTYDQDAVLGTLRSATQTLSSASYKVRLLAAKDGQASAEATPLSAGKDIEPLVVCLAGHPADPADVFLYHKTTNRRRYDDAKSSCPGYDDVVLWNKNREITESCIANVVVDMDGELFTPPVECGLLGGVYRERLIRDGKVKEKVITIEELVHCSRIYLVNSVRRTREVILKNL